MNERVWLQSGRPFVNKRIAHVCVLCAALLGACSERAPEASPASEAAPEAAVAEIASATREIPAIWETERSEAPFASLAVMTARAGAVYVAGATADGAISVFDLDGARTARSIETPGPVQLATGSPIFGETAILAPAISAEGRLQAILIELASGGVGRVSVDVDETFDAICADEAREDVIPMALSTGDTLILGRMFVSGDAAVFEADERVELGAPVTRCAIHGEAVLAAAGGALHRVSNGLPQRVADNVPSPTSLNYGFVADLEIALWTDMAGVISAADLSGGDASTPFSISAGLSVAAPDPIALTALKPGRVGADYEAGFLATTGGYEDGAARITYVDFASAAPDAG